MQPAASGTEVVEVDPTGVTLRAEVDVAVDVLFDERRIWSFWTLRDTAPAGGGRRHAPWPPQMDRYLDGRVRLTVRTHVAEEVLLDEERSFGTSPERIRVVNADGVELATDKTGRLKPTFAARSARDVEPLLDAIDVVIAALRDAGVEPFPAYGTLLGAVRDGALIGHDSDADLGYVSRHEHPADVIRESFRLQRHLVAAGFPVVRYSGGGFKVVVREADGQERGLDVFTGFLTDGQLILMGEVRAPFERSWIFPLGTTTLEGRTLPAPAEPERLLAVTYGPSWRTPDPAFKFETPASTTVRLDDWFRGTVNNRGSWDARYQQRRREEPGDEPSELARLVGEQEGAASGSPADLVVDLGCGRGVDTRWLARQAGVPALGLDYSARGFEYLAEHDGEPGRLEFAQMNVLELRQTLGWGARLGAQPGRRVLMARHLVDALAPRGRQHLARFAEMVCGGGEGGGRAYLEFLVPGPAADDGWARRHKLEPVDPDRLARALEARSGTVLAQEILAGHRTGAGRRRGSARRAEPRRRVCRMVVAWP